MIYRTSLFFCLLLTATTLNGVAVIANEISPDSGIPLPPNIQSTEPSLGSPFEEWCLQQEQLSPAAQHTVEVTLRQVGTDNCRVANQKLSNSTELNIQWEEITDIRPIAGLTHLKTLYLECNPITDFTPLSRLTNLESLDLECTRIKNLSPLAGLINLEDLDLSDNQIADVSPLAGLINLKGLDLSVNQIADVSPLAGLINLEVLHLHHNQITDIRSLATLINLHTLYLTENAIAQPFCPVSPPNVCEFEHIPPARSQ